MSLTPLFLGMENWKELLPYVGTIITTAAAWNKDRIFSALNIKKEETNIESNQIEILKKNLELYQEMIDDLKVRFENQLKQVESDYLLQIEKHREFIRKCSRSLKYYEDNCKCIPADFE